MAENTLGDQINYLQNIHINEGKITTLQKKFSNNILWWFLFSNFIYSTATKNCFYNTYGFNSFVITGTSFTRYLLDYFESCVINIANGLIPIWLFLHFELFEYVWVDVGFVVDCGSCFNFELGTKYLILKIRVFLIEIFVYCLGPKNFKKVKKCQNSQKSKYNNYYIKKLKY
ncbi:hypothetical protein BpHYR1_021925 [Brachionus plicatilis]|uniref:Uncharacterized protein n=1 Tax=Brachionus plicatilis TaxID=10195 RepID=A0A3M7QTQ0_BRAPC|nr:hypothetical protein BpHYR1_021925 [Brachionus plicatilis]